MQRRDKSDSRCRDRAAAAMPVACMLAAALLAGCGAGTASTGGGANANAGAETAPAATASDGADGSEPKKSLARDLYEMTGVGFVPDEDGANALLETPLGLLGSLDEG